MTVGHGFLIHSMSDSIISQFPSQSEIEISRINSQAFLPYRGENGYAPDMRFREVELATFNVTYQIDFFIFAAMSTITVGESSYWRGAGQNHTSIPAIFTESGKYTIADVYNDQYPNGERVYFYLSLDFNTGSFTFSGYGYGFDDDCRLYDGNHSGYNNFSFIWGKF